MAAITHDTVALFAKTAEYYDLELGTDPATAFAAAAGELRFPGYLKPDDERPPDEYATHNYVMRAVGTYAKRAGLGIPAEAICGAERPLGTCGRLRIPGFDSCHWHGASATPDHQILATLQATIEAG